MELHPLVACGLLVPVKVNEKGEEMSVVVKDKNGKLQVRKRCLLQLGPTPVTFANTAPRGGVVAASSVKMAISFAKRHTAKEVWDKACLNPKGVVRAWLRDNTEAGDIPDMLPPRWESDSVQVIVVMKGAGQTSVLRAAGVGGVFSRRWYPKREDGEMQMDGELEKEFRTVPLPLEQDLESCRRTAIGLGDLAYGVLPFGKGFGVRVKLEKFAEVLARVNPSASSACAEKWEVAGLPLSWDKDDVKQFLASWDAEPVFSFRKGFSKTWIVRADKEPTHNIVQHDFGLAVIKPAQSRPKPVTKVFAWKPGKSSGKPPEAGTWAAMIAQPPAMVRQGKKEEEKPSGGVQKETASAPAEAAVMAARYGAKAEGKGDMLALPAQPSVVVPAVSHHLAPPLDFAAMIRTAVEEALDAKLGSAVAPLRREIAAVKAVQEERMKKRKKREEGDATDGTVEASESDPEAEVRGRGSHKGGVLQLRRPRPASAGAVGAGAGAQDRKAAPY